MCHGPAGTSGARAPPNCLDICAPMSCQCDVPQFRQPTEAYPGEGLGPGLYSARTNKRYYCISLWFGPNQFKACPFIGRDSDVRILLLERIS